MILIRLYMKNKIKLEIKKVKIKKNKIMTKNEYQYEKFLTCCQK